MASLQMMKPASCSPFPCTRVMERDCETRRKGVGVMRLRRRRGSCGKMVRNSMRVCCKVQDGDDRSNSNNNGEAPESLFMKELRRRGISPTSLLEESNRSTVEQETIEEGGDASSWKRNAVATGSDKSLTNQRETSMALNSEGLEGLIPRAKVLVTLGGTFFLAFWPLIIVTVASFTALYLYFGPTFVHDGTNNPVAPPPYIDPYVLLQEERIIK